MATKNYIYYTEEEDRDLLNFVAEKTRNAVKPLQLGILWSSYIEHSKTERSLKSLCSRFRDNLVPKMHELLTFDLDTKIRMVFATQYPVKEEFERQILQSGYLQLNHDRCIINYKSSEEDGLELSLIDENGKIFRRAGRNIRNFGEIPPRVRKRKNQQISTGNYDYLEQFLPGNQGNHQNYSEEFRIHDNYYHDGIQNVLEDEVDMNVAREVKVEDYSDDVGTSSGIVNTFAPQLPHSTSSPMKSTTSLKDFLKLLRILVVSFESPELGQLRENVVNAIGELGDNDKQIPLQKIRLALETTLALVNG